MSNCATTFQTSSLTQELNNHAASMMLQLRYDEAISSLAKALQFCKHYISTAKSPVSCTSGDCCSLESCIEHSVSQMNRSNDIPMGEYRRTTEHIHRQPILMNPSWMRCSHSLVHAMPLILTFNLALVHHLKGLDEKVDAEVKRKCLLKAQRFYALSHKLYSDSLCHPLQRNLWFEMMVSNNLGQLYKSTNNETKHIECIRILMAVIVVFVDRKTPIINAEDFIGFVANASNLLLPPCVTAAAA